MSIGIDISYFVPFKLGAELCGENGLPMCPYATRIIGRAEVLKLWFFAIIAFTRNNSSERYILKL